MSSSSCPSNSFTYNTSQCACNPGYFLNTTTNSCTLYTPSSSSFTVNTGVDYSLSFPETIFSFDSIKKFTKSQAVFLEATLVMLLSWLVFCIFVRCKKVGDGNSLVFKIRWWISRLDVCFSTRHWLDDQKVVVKRKTELGGALSIASWVLFIGLFAALVYQIISKRSVEVHNIRASNAPDLVSFQNDMEFNITTVSSMSCSNLRGLGNSNIGYPGSIDQRVAPLSDFANYSCQNTSMGPTISLSCKNCQLIQDSLYISWWFVDLPNNPATAVGFQFNITAKDHANKKHLSFVSGVLKNGSNLDDRPVTFRGTDPNILKFNLFPRLYHNFHDLKLIQPLFHEFLPGSSFKDINKLQTSLQNSNNGLINTTIYVNFLSAYILEIDSQDIWDPVSFLADLGGLYCISIAIFFYILVQFEYRIKRLRVEDSVLRRIRNQQKAKEHWDKLRKYVMYTWGWDTLDDDYRDSEQKACCTGRMVELRRNGSSRRQRYSKDSAHLNRKTSLPRKKNAAQGQVQTVETGAYLQQTVPNAQKLSNSRDTHHEMLDSIEDGKNHTANSDDKKVSHCQAFPSTDHKILPPLPSLDYKAGSETDISEIQKNLKYLYDYNVMLREKLLDTQSMLQSLMTKSSSSSKDTQRSSER